MLKLPEPLKRRLSRRLVRAASDRAQRADMSLGELAETLGDRSFAWSIVVFALVNLVPMPIGSNMITSIPLIIVTLQMARGQPRVQLPGFLMHRRVSRKGFQKLVLGLGPLIRPVERILKQRHEWLFAPRRERGLAVFLVIVALALFVPIPLSGYLPATALFLTGVGLVERDGLVVMGGLALGLVAIVVTIGVGVMLVWGAQVALAA